MRPDNLQNEAAKDAAREYAHQWATADREEIDAEELDTGTPVYSGCTDRIGHVAGYREEETREFERFAPIYVEPVIELESGDGREIEKDPNRLLRCTECGRITTEIDECGNE